jgi:hypothetical protein
LTINDRYMEDDDKHADLSVIIKECQAAAKAWTLGGTD